MVTPSGPIAIAFVMHMNVSTNVPPNAAASSIGRAAIIAAPPTAAIAAHCASIAKNSISVRPRALEENLLPYSLQAMFCTA